MAKTRLRTRQEARRELIRKGISITQWAKQHGVSSDMVRRVLAKEVPCNFGQSHKIAVLLGIKDGEIVDC